MRLMWRESRIRSIYQEAFFVALDSNLGAVVGEKEEAVASVLGNEGTIAQAWVNVRGGTRIVQHTSGTRRDGPQEMRLSWKRC